MFTHIGSYEFDGSRLSWAPTGGRKASPPPPYTPQPSETVMEGTSVPPSPSISLTPQCARRLSTDHGQQESFKY